MDWNEQYPKETQPSLQAMEQYIASPLFAALQDWLKRAYQTEPSMAYSGCGMRPGWNLKYKKSGKALCTLYPDDGFFVALVVIGQKESEAAALLAQGLSPAVRKIYEETPDYMGQRWLMIPLRDGAALEDVKTLIALRVRPKGI